MKNKTLIIYMIGIIIVISNVFFNSTVYSAHVAGCSSSDTKTTYTPTGSTTTHKVEVTCTACGGLVLSSNRKS